MKLTLPAPAKINLWLHITGRREDGYHNLQTLFQLLDWGDQISFEPNQSGQIELHDPVTGVSSQENLIVRAAQKLRAHTPVVPPGVKFH